MAKKDIPEDEGPSDAWLASYADAMTLLLAFFIMMYAFALVDLAMFQDIMIGVSAAFGRNSPVTDSTDSVLEDGSGMLPELGFNPVMRTDEEERQDAARREDLAEAGVVTPENAEDLRALLDNEFQRLGAGDLVEVGIDERGVFIRFDGRVLFAPNEAELDTAGMALLATASDVLDLIDNPLEIEGHTDNQPTGGEWVSNWELSSARASRVVRWMIANGGIPDPQLMAVGRADTRPRGDNSTSEGRAENRRVEIVVRVAGIPGSSQSPIDPIGDNPLDLDDPPAVDGSPDAPPPEVLPAGEPATQTPAAQTPAAQAPAAQEPVIEAPADAGAPPPDSGQEVTSETPAADGVATDDGG